MEQQRRQLDEQERQVAQLRARIALLEGGINTSISGLNGNTVDDFSIKVRRDLSFQGPECGRKYLPQLLTAHFPSPELCVSTRQTHQQMGRRCHSIATGTDATDGCRDHERHRWRSERLCSRRNINAGAKLPATCHGRNRLGRRHQLSNCHQLNRGQRSAYEDP